MTTLDILFYFFIIVTGIQFLYYFGFLLLFALHKSEKGKSYNIPISVIICAKNEAENLKLNLSKIIEQDYPNFEIVLINDSSWDNTLEVIENFAEKHKSVRIVNVKSIEPFWGNKKYALTLGIKAAKHDFLIFTDADCIPASNQWLKLVSSHFSNKTSVILGYGAYKKNKYSLLNKLIRFETLMTAIQYFSYANVGIPYMGVGRNMAYRKEEFFNNGGFMNHMSIKSGDDDLLIKDIATNSNTIVCYSKESHTLSEPKKNLKDWITQKRRHISTARYYKPLHKFLLGLFYFTQLTFWVIFTVLISALFKWEIILGFLAVRILLQLIVIGISANKLNEKDLTLLAPFLEIFLIIFQLIIFSANLISKPKYWK